MVSSTPTDIESRFFTLHREWWPAIARLIDELVESGTEEGSLLRRMVEYHLGTGGKRLRAILPLLIGEALGGDPAHLVPFGAACEMLHNASLVHDDLQDGDAVRRGRETVWKRFGVSQAINLGDAMIALTILLMQRLDLAPAPRERATRRLLLEMLRVIEGQVEDLDLGGRDEVSIDDYLHMVEGKTSRLFALPMSGAALLCGASSAVEQGLVESACHVGVLFQVQDDLLDLYGTGTGEEVGRDVREGKLTLLAAHCLATAPAGERERLLGVLHKPRASTTDSDVAAARELFDRTGSLAFALDELARRKDAALAVPGLAGEPRLLEVLAEACDLFLGPVAAVFPALAPLPRAARAG